MHESPIAHSHLFTVRLWREEGSSGEIEYRGQVQHVISGQLRHFRDWKTLIDFCRSPFDDGQSEMRALDVENLENDDHIDDAHDKSAHDHAGG